LAAFWFQLKRQKGWSGPYDETGSGTGFYCKACWPPDHDPAHSIYLPDYMWHLHDLVEYLSILDKRGLTASNLGYL